MSRTALGLLAAALALWHGWFFLTGYLTTADDVFFIGTYLSGPQTLWEITVGMAQGHGRIGFYGLMPLNMWAAYLSVSVGWRVVFVGIYIAGAALTFVYAARLLRREVALLGFLLWLALHPLGFDHLPPVAYPLQNALPILLLVGLRLWALERGEAGIWMLLGRLVQIALMLVTEFAALFGFAMIAAESFVRHPLGGQGARDWLRGVLRDGAVWRDLITVLAVLGAYLGYRLAFPSTYVGNQIDGATELGDLSVTTLWHVLEGLVPFRLEAGLFAAPLPMLAAAILAGLVMALAVYHALGRRLEPVSLRPVLLFLLGAILLVTLPLTATRKQQELCVIHDSCAYLDSRSSIFGVVLMLVVLAIWGRAVIWRPLVAGLAGVCFALGSLNNAQVARQMQPYTAVWQRAEALACVPQLVPENPAYLAQLIDPEGYMPLLYAPGGPEGFWPFYLSKAAGWSACADHPVLAAARNQSYLPRLSRSDAARFTKYLGSGWHRPEPGGVWSSGSTAQILVVPEGLAAGEEATLEIRGVMFFEGDLTRQRLEVVQAGQTLLRREVSAQEPGCCRFDVPLLPHDPSQGVITLTLRLPDARKPADLSGDGPRLGLFLQGLSLR